MTRAIQVVDLFAGPGGLAEGFSAFEDGAGHQPFNVVLSVEKEASAFQTLRLRTFLRQFEGDLPPEYYAHLNEGRQQPDWSILYPEEWKNASEEAVRAELGSQAGNALIEPHLAEIEGRGVDTVVIGGPPCQAYSLAGRVRNQGNAGYVAELDHRHYLYQEYINILKRLNPVAFVMENVKGILSSSVSGARIFGQVLQDLRAAGGEPGSYRLFAIARDPFGRMALQQPEYHDDYILLSERFGVPQTRHRVIIVGLRADLAHLVDRVAIRTDPPPRPSTLRHVLTGIPKLRSALSADDSEEAWRSAVLRQMDRVCRALNGSDAGEAHPRVLAAAESARERIRLGKEFLTRSDSGASDLADDCPVPLAEWLRDPLLKATPNHLSRSHMEDDLGRYFFCAVFAEATGRSPKAGEFPRELAPSHANWSTGKFADRFRAQPWNAPATTITSHISKDGHYFIHPDPSQCRALTVREAARLQTFPDNYLFLGNRTEQYVQVGNAVPPFLARQIAGALWSALSAGETAEHAGVEEQVLEGA